MTKNAGFLASCTSNGTLLDSETLKKVVDSGLDVLALSLAGLEKTNERNEELSPRIEASCKELVTVTGGGDVGIGQGICPDLES